MERKPVNPIDSLRGQNLFGSARVFLCGILG